MRPAFVAHTAAHKMREWSDAMPNVTTRNLNTLPDGEHYAADNLFLLVRGNSRSFIFRYVAPSGARRKLSIGSAKKIGLADARAEADRCRVILAKGLDPKDVRDQAKAQQRSARAADVTFNDFWPGALEEYCRLRLLRPRSVKTYESNIRCNLAPVLGDVPLQQLTTTMIADRIRPLWNSHPANAAIARSLLENILGLAVRDGIIKHNPANWRGALDMFLAPTMKIRAVKHLGALTLEQMQSAAKLIAKSGQNVSWPTIFIMLTACRAGEATRSTWTEIDEDFSVWTVPPEHRKDGRKEPHRVPLSKQAAAILRHVGRGEDMIFPININTPNRVLKRFAGVKAVTLHGCRSTFSQWAAENGIDFEVRETCLMHAVGNAVTRAYQRSDLLDRRREVMQRWADEILPMDVLLKALATKKPRRLGPRPIKHSN